MEECKQAVNLITTLMDDQMTLSYKWDKKTQTEIRNRFKATCDILAHMRNPLVRPVLAILHRCNHAAHVWDSDAWSELKKAGSTV